MRQKFRPSQQGTRQLRSRAQLLEQSYESYASAVTTTFVAPITKNRAQAGDVCLACNKPIQVGTRMWTGYDAPNKKKTKYHWDHKPN